MIVHSGSILYLRHIDDKDERFFSYYRLQISDVQFIFTHLLNFSFECYLKFICTVIKTRIGLIKICLHNYLGCAVVTIIIILGLYCQLRDLTYQPIASLTFTWCRMMRSQHVDSLRRHQLSRPGLLLITSSYPNILGFWDSIGPHYLRSNPGSLCVRQ